MIKLALLSFLFIFLLVTAMSLFIPSHIRISKATNILTCRDSVFRLINDTSKWKEWHPWFMQSPALMSKIKTKWKVQNDSVSTIQLSQPDKKTLLNSWELYHHDFTDSLTLQWYMDFYPKWYPWEKFGSLFYEKNYGTVMEQGLSNLKTRLQK